MQLVQKHNIKKNSYHGTIIDKNLLLSKNLYNSAIYTIRQFYFTNNSFLNYHNLEKKFKINNQPDYIALPRKVSQQVLMQVDQSFRSFFKALKAYKENPNKFNGKPKLPGYKHKTSGRNLLVYTNQAISKKDLSLSGLKNIKLPTKIPYKDICQARIIPGNEKLYHSIEIIYNKLEKQKIVSDNYSAIDLGISNLATITFNKDHNPIIVPGGPLKSINQFYNKKRSRLQSRLPNNRYTSKNIQKLTDKRNNKISDYMHKSSTYIVNQLVTKNISKLIIGYNKNWKQETNMGKINNQNFVQIPHGKFVNLLSYKCKLNGIEMEINEESYTSKCSFLDLEKIKKHDIYKGKRVYRGLFKSANGKIINADINGSLNIMRKAIPNLFNKDGIEDVIVHPIRLKPYKDKIWDKIL